MKLAEMNGTERIAYRNVKGIFNWEVGGWYNCILDGCEEYIPDTIQEAKQIIYDESLTDTARDGYYGCNKAPKEMRFAGADFIWKCIDFLFAEDEDGDVCEIAEAKGWDVSKVLDTH